MLHLTRRWYQFFSTVEQMASSITRRYFLQAKAVNFLADCYTARRKGSLPLCVLTNPKGRLVLYYRNVQQEDAKLLVYDVSFRNLDILRTEALRWLDLLRKARSPEELPGCPSWMARFCKYAPSCGCGCFWIVITKNFMSIVLLYSVLINSM